MSVLYIASSQPGAGKTALATTLAHQVDDSGKKAMVVHEDEPTAVEAAVEKAANDADVVIVEAPTSIPDEQSNDLADSLDAKVVIVVPFGTTVGPEALSATTKAFGDRLVGVIINGRTLYKGTDTTANIVPSLAGAGIQVLGVIPEDRRLLSITVGQLAEHLDGRFLVREDLTDALVEHFLVGGLGLDSGEFYFGLKEDKAAIVRGDRPDIQMAALATPTACLVVTNGIEPIEYVTYEADLEEVPVILVESDTLDTMAALNDVQKHAAFDHTDKVERFGGLLREHVDLDSIYSGLGLAA